MAKKPESITIAGSEFAGITIYDGPSAINGEDIIGLITFNTRNPKTGDMAQLWILPKNVAPHEARSTSLTTGQASPVCGTCPVMSVCYVNLAGPAGNWVRFHKGLYPLVSLSDPAVVAQLQSKPIRLGAYGEPAALPYATVRRLSELTGWTGYTHLYESCDPRFAELLMASCEDQRTRSIARGLGFRTFTILEDDGTPSTGEIMCPESTGRTDCARCQLCNGKHGENDRRKDITIKIHGTSAKRFAIGSDGLHVRLDSFGSADERRIS